MSKSRVGSEADSGHVSAFMTTERPPRSGLSENSNTLRRLKDPELMMLGVLVVLIEAGSLLDHQNL
jgi:hypothetical protein